MTEGERELLEIYDRLAGQGRAYAPGEEADPFGPAGLPVVGVLTTLGVDAPWITPPKVPSPLRHGMIVAWLAHV